MKSVFASAWARWRQFWFEADGTSQLRLFRICFACLAFALYSIRSLDLNLFYSNSGIFPRAVMHDVPQFQLKLSLFDFFSSNTAIWIGNGVFLACLVSLAFGIRTRLSAFLAWVLHVSFLARDMAVVYGVDLIAAFFLLYLSLADDRPRRSESSRTLTSMGYRLCQIQVCVIYAYSGLQKLRGVTWWSGEALWAALANSQTARWELNWLSHLPVFVSVCTYFVLLWEIYFPVLIWVRPMRKPMLWIGVAIHLGIAVTLNIPFFGALMIVSYCLFLDDAAANAIFSKFEAVSKNSSFLLKLRAWRPIG